MSANLTQVADLIWHAQTTEDVERIAKIVTEMGMTTIPVGRDNNIGTIRMASDLDLAMIERLTNEIGLLLDLAVALNPGASPADAGGGREFARRSGRRTPGDDRHRTPRDGQNLVILLHEPNNKLTPT